MTLLGGSSFVAVVKSADLWNRHDSAAFLRLNRLCAVADFSLEFVGTNATKYYSLRNLAAIQNLQPRSLVRGRTS